MWKGTYMMFLTLSSNPPHNIYSHSYILPQHRVISFVTYEKQERISLAVKGLH